MILLFYRACGLARFMKDRARFNAFFHNYAELSYAVDKFHGTDLVMVLRYFPEMYCIDTFSIYGITNIYKMITIFHTYCNYYLFYVIKFRINGYINYLFIQYCAMCSYLIYFVYFINVQLMMEAS